MKPTNQPQDQKFRRDPRLALDPGAGLVELVLGTRAQRGHLTCVNLSGLAVTFDASVEIEAGDEIPGAVVVLGDTAVQGDLAVRNVRRESGELRVGGLFWPRSGSDEAKWLAVVPKLGATAASTPLFAIRCGSCHRAICLDHQPDGGTSVAECAHCTQQHLLPELSPLRQNITLDKAREVAREHRIDLPAAYSILLRILTVEQVLDTYEPEHGVAKPSAEPDAEVQAFELDPAFEAAIEAGTVTRAQAAQRGSRSAFAAKLMDRHRLSEAAALDVADNRVLVIDAIRARGALDPIQVAEAESSRNSREIVALLAMLAVFVLAVAAFELRETIGAAEEAQRTAAAETLRSAMASTTTRVDDHGEVIEIRGSDPRNVLITYCNKLDREAPPTPIEIVQPYPPEHGVRLGIFTDPRHGGDRFAIRIQRQGRVRDWVAGGKDEPIPVLRAPNVPPLTPRIPVQ